jgi:hypothetical protein
MVRPQYVERGATEFCQAVQCGHPDAFAQLSLLLWIAALTLLTIVACVRISQAQDEVMSELARVRAERNAFRRFRQAVAKLTATRPQTAEISSASGVVQREPSDSELDSVREAYRETVMSVSHYEEDYGESLSRHLCAEFGEEIAAAVVGGEQFTPHLKQALLQQATANQVRREKLMRVLESESEALTAYADRFDEIEADCDEAVSRPLLQQSYEDLDGAWATLDDLQTDLDDLLAERQSRLDRDLSVGPAQDGQHAFQQYVYSELGSDYPVLSSGVRLYERIRAAKRDVALALARRV